jgi:RHS repeat-associated protein
MPLAFAVTILLALCGSMRAQTCTLSIPCCSNAAVTISTAGQPTYNANSATVNINLIAVKAEGCLGTNWGSFNIDFGDGTSTQTNVTSSSTVNLTVSHVYTLANTCSSVGVIYTVNVCFGTTETGPGCGFTNTISVAHPGMSVTPSYTLSNCNTVSFSFTPQFPVGNWQWNFGDNASSPLNTSGGPQIVTHTYPAGSFTAYLAGQGISPCTVTVPVTVYAYPGTGFTYTIPDVCDPNGGVNMTIQNYSATGVTYNWSINNNSQAFISQGANYPNYFQQGLNTVVLTVSNGTCSATATQTFYMGPPAVTGISATNINCKTFNICYSPAGLTSAQWAFGDGSNSSVITNPAQNCTVHTYPGPGTYVISLSAYGLPTCTVNTTVAVSDFTLADFTYTIVDVCDPAQGMILAISGYNSLYTYQWQINGFLVNSAGQSAAYTQFFQNGGNTIKLIVTYNNCSTSTIKTVNIGAPIANFGITSPVCVGDMLNTYGVASGGNTYTWKIQKPDNSWETPINGMYPFYTFNAAGVYQVSLEIVYNPPVGGPCKSGYATNVTAYTTPTANFTVSPVSCNNAVTLTLPTGNVFTSYNISYGDGTTHNVTGTSINSAHLTHTYTTSGYTTFPISVTLVNGPCTNTYSQSIILNNNASLVVTTPNEYLCPGTSGQVNTQIVGASSGIGPWVYTWTGPNGFTSTQSSISPTIGGLYQVTVTSTGNCPLSLTGSKSLTTLGMASGTLGLVTNISCTTTGGGTAEVTVPDSLQKQGFYLNGVLYPANSSASGPATFTVTGLAQGPNYILISNALSESCNTTILVNITKDEPTLTVNPTQPENCAPGTGSATVTRSPNFGTTTWFTQANYPGSPSFTSGINAHNLAPGIYVVQNVYGTCTTSSNFSIVQPNITIGKSMGAGSCSAATTPVTISAQWNPSSITTAFTYVMKRFTSPGATTVIAGSGNVFALAPGFYSVQVTSGGCSNSYTFQVTELEDITLNFNINEPNCQDKGSIQALVSGGDGNYTYKWYVDNVLDNTTTNFYAVPTLTAAITISLQVTDQSGCEAEGPNPVITMNPTSPVVLQTCSATPGATLQGTSNAAIVTTCEIGACVTGGVGPYKFEWFKDEVVSQVNEWRFRYFNGQFITISGGDTMTITAVPSNTTDIKNGVDNNNADYNYSTIYYPYWVQGSPYVPMHTPAGVLAVGTATSGDADHYFRVLETTTTSVQMLKGSYSGPSGTLYKNKDFTNGDYTLHVTDANGCKYIFSMGTLTFQTAADVPVAFDFVWGINPRPEEPGEPFDASMAANELLEAAGKCMQQKTAALKTALKNTCTDPSQVIDDFRVSYELNEHHYTLYYYDRAGQLVKTVPPQGVQYLSTTEVDDVRKRRSDGTSGNWHVPAHQMATTYQYNSFGQLLEQETPDGGVTKFIYDSKNRLRFSQNEKQANMIPAAYSYTKYDDLGRIVEVGESELNSGGFPDFSNVSSQGNVTQADVLTFPLQSANGANHRQVTRTFYSALTGMTYYGKTQQYVQNRVSYTMLDENPYATGDEYYTYYSYDAHGNVEWLVHDDAGGIGKNYISYEYDLVSGKVLKVKYNEKRADRFFHRYQYDGENRLVKTETSRDGELWDADARYEYYPHGPLKRNVIGEDHVQGLDYIYTIHGWMKSVNSPHLSQAADPGNNVGGTAYEAIANDRFGMVLKYYLGDYTSATSNFLITNPAYLMAAYSSTNGPAPDLYNGNISGWVHSQLNGLATNTIAARADLFRYDVLNRIKQSASLEEDNTAPNLWKTIGGSASTYSTNYSYDANGNILTLNRYDQAGAALDELVYKYDGPMGSPAVNTNQLSEVTENNNSQVDGAFTKGPLPSQYLYDQTGNLIKETGSEYLTINSSPGVYQYTTEIKWTVYGKIKEVNKSIDITGPQDLKERLRFNYDATGNRVMKEHWKDNEMAPVGDINDEELTVTYYVRDAQGNTMSTYQRYFDATDNKFKLALIEQPIYGSDRVGMNNQKVVLASALSLANLSMPNNGFNTLSEYQNWITSTSKTNLLPDGTTGANLCQCKVLSVELNNNSSNYQYASNQIELLGIANNGIAVAEDLNQDLQFYAVAAKRYLGSNDALLIFDRFGKLMKGTEIISSIDPGAKPVIVNISGTDMYAVVTLNANKKPVYHVVDMSKLGWDPLIPRGEVINANNVLQSYTNNNIIHGGHFTGMEDHISGHSIVYSTRYTPDPNDQTKGTTEVVSYDFGTSTVTPSPNSIHSVYGCGSTYPGELQISPDGNKLAWYYLDEYIGGFTYRRGDLYTIPLDNTKTGVLGNVSVQPISEAGNHGDGSLDWMKNSQDLLYAQRGVYKEGCSTCTTKYDRNVWKYDALNLPTLSAINPNANPLISYLFGEIKRGQDGNYYIPQMGKRTEKIHSYGGSTFNQNVPDVSPPDTLWKLASSLPTQVYKIFEDQSNFLNEFQRSIGNKSYELKDHLGNVRVVVSDMKIGQDNDGSGDKVLDEFKPEVKSYSDYYAFGMMMPGRQFNGGDYRYGFNGKEKFVEFHGNLSTYDFEARFYDSRLGRFLARDPKEKETPYIATYAAFLGNPIYVIDADGQSGDATLDKKSKTITIKSTIYFYGSKATPEMAKETAGHIQKMWNDAAGKVTIDGVQYDVKFEVNGVYKTEAEAEELAKNNGDNAESNFVRVVDGSKMDFKSSKMQWGGNAGVFIDYEMGNGKTTDAHEYGHGLKWYEEGEADNGTHDADIENGVPGIMSPRGTPVADEYGYAGQPAGKKTVDPAKRKVLSSDVNKLGINVDELKKTGKTKVGKAKNTIYNEDGTPR